MIVVTDASFREHYPEFSDTVLYSESAVGYWLSIATLLLTERWTKLIDHGCELFMAHNLVLEMKAQAEASLGGAPGITTGPVNSQSVDKVAVAYDTSAGIESDAGHWNNTIYGTRFIRLVRMIGAGPVQIGFNNTLYPLSSANAWYGPNTAFSSDN